MQITDLEHRLAELGAKPAHRDAVLRAWLHALPLETGSRRQPGAQAFPLRLRQALPGLTEELQQLLRLQSEHPGNDGSVRRLYALHDGQLIESVLLPRDGLCLSCQVGCAVGCRFCMTGRSGLLRQLSSLEMLAQVVQARRSKPIRKVVFMGMGEPAHNIDNVIATIELLGRAADIGHKNLVFSTVGDDRVFSRLPQMQVKPALALSLHSTDDERRQQLLPHAPRIPVVELLERAQAYAEQVGYPIQLQWTLLAGINDGADEVDALIELLRGKYMILNLIPYNSSGEGALDPYQRPAGERIVSMVRALQSQGILTKVRQSAGQDVEGACGQLRARALHLRPARRSRTDVT